MAKGFYIIVSKLADSKLQKNKTIIMTSTRKPNKTASKSAEVMLFMPTTKDGDVSVLKSNRTFAFSKDWRI